jgi:hypothetical protein
MPASFTVKRSLDLRAPADELFPRVADFNAWRRGAPPRGYGAVQAARRPQIAEPFNTHNVAEFTFEPHVQSTT